jgi:hypothetical protein
MMLTKFSMTLAFALLLGMGSAALAAPKHVTRHHQGRIEHQVPAAGYRSYGYAGAQAAEPTYMHIQDEDWRNQLGD